MRLVYNPTEKKIIKYNQNNLILKDKINKKTIKKRL